jgi:hypothetical protein
MCASQNVTRRHTTSHNVTQLNHFSFNGWSFLRVIHCGHHRRGVTINGYMGSFFWFMDIIAIASIFPDISWVANVSIPRPCCRLLMFMFYNLRHIQLWKAHPSRMLRVDTWRVGVQCSQVSRDHVSVLMSMSMWMYVYTLAFSHSHIRALA